MSEKDSRLLEWLAEHPRMMGVLFTIMFLMMEVGTVIAKDGSTNTGP